MAVATTKHVTHTYVVDGIKRCYANAYVGTGDDHYFAFINQDDHAVVWHSNDDGKTWNKLWDFGQQFGITITLTQDGSSVCATYWSTGRIAVALDGSEISVGSVATTGKYTIFLAVCYYPLLLINAGDYYTRTSAVRVDKKSSFAPDVPGSVTDIGGGVDSVLGYSSDGNYVAVTFYLPSDSNYAARANAGYVSIATPTDVRLSAIRYPADSYRPPDNTYVWAGLADNYAKCGYRSFPDFEGVSTGWSYFYYGLQQTQASYYSPGLDIAPAGYVPAGDSTPFDTAPETAGSLLKGNSVRADRGLTGTHISAFMCKSGDHPVFVYVDNYGLIGSVTYSNDLDKRDANNRGIPYSRARVYGDLPGYPTVLMWGEPQQPSNSLTFFVLASDNPKPNNTVIISSGQGAVYTEFGVEMHLVRINDSNVLQDRRAKNVMLQSHALQLTTVVDAPASTATDLGTINSDGGASGYDIPSLILALTGNTTAVPNPNNSHGCSPVLRALMVQSGVPHAVEREVFRDGDSNGHQGGNAIDLTAPQAESFAGSNEDAVIIERAELGTIADFLRQVPQLFASVVYYDETGYNSLFIWDGKITTAKHFGGTSSKIVQDSKHRIHVSSSRARMLGALKRTDVLAALGAVPPVVDDNGHAARDNADLFAADRYVYVENRLVDEEVARLNAGNGTADGTDFW